MANDSHAPGSRRVTSGPLGVPFREVTLTNGEVLRLYDTQGPAGGIGNIIRHLRRVSARPQPRQPVPFRLRSPRERPIFLRLASPMRTPALRSRVRSRPPVLARAAQRYGGPCARSRSRRIFVVAGGWTTTVRSASRLPQPGHR